MKSFRGGVFSLLCVGMLAACSTGPQQQVEWSDASARGALASLRGQKVLVDCDSADTALRLRCNAALLREVQAAGGQAVGMPVDPAQPSGVVGDEQVTAAAFAVGAAAVFTVSIAPGSARSAGSGLSLGLGGFSFGGGGGVGVGLSAPLGGTAPAIGLSANGRITDPGEGKLLWSSTFAASPSADLGAQADSLVASLALAAKRAGFF